jgi:hypothetical protein
MQVPDALVSLRLLVYQEQRAFADFIRASGPSKDWSVGVRQEAARRQSSLEDSERALKHAMQDQASTEDQMRELRHALSRRVAASLAEQDAEARAVPAETERTSGDSTQNDYRL